MGALVSSILGPATPAQPLPPPPKVVLVPPFFQRDVRGLSRFCRSSYDYLGNRKQLSRLLRDHLSSDLCGRLLLSPPDDPRVSVRAKLRHAGGSMVLRWQPATATAVHTFLEMAANLNSPRGDVCVRGSYLHPGTGLGAFMVAPLERRGGPAAAEGAAQVGVRYSSTNATAGAIFIPRRGDLDKLWLAGRLYGLTLGLQLSPQLPVRQAISALPSCLPELRPPLGAPPPVATDPTNLSSNGDSDGGSSSRSGGSCGGGSSSLAGMKSWFRSHASVLLSYSPPPRPGAAGSPFTASVEMAEGGPLTFSFFQHVAVTRQVVNPFEEDEVVGITNYLDIGLQLTTAAGPTATTTTTSTLDSSHPAGTQRLIQPPPSASSTPTSTTATTTATTTISGSSNNPTAAATATATPDAATPASAPSINLAVSWQINKNWLLKGRVGSQCASAAVGARVWHAVSAYLTACVEVDFARPTSPRYGVELCVENFGPLQYERGADDVAVGRALLQRHEASPQDLDNFAGRGVLVRRNAQDHGGPSDQTRAQKREVEEAARRRVAELM